jgi:hypothetical protein
MITDQSKTVTGRTNPQIKFGKEILQITDKGSGV